LHIGFRGTKSVPVVTTRFLRQNFATIAPALSFLTCQVAVCSGAPHPVSGVSRTSRESSRLWGTLLLHARCIEMHDCCQEPPFQGTYGSCGPVCPPHAAKAGVQERNWMCQAGKSIPSPSCRLPCLRQSIRCSWALPCTAAWWALQHHLVDTLPQSLSSDALSPCCKTGTDLAVAEKPSPPDTI